ncbi:hypothetical protein VNI00_000438 [Paramarasmius palmivorus]|uniref:Neurotrophin-3 n=1 Tax=Paramarasmius palmivorus TaxID=297713 RepID=A0AAW0E6B2_9AGAR
MTVLVMNGGNYDAESARTVQLEGVAIKSLKDVREPSLDPRVDIITPPSAEDLDRSYLDQLVHHKESVEKEGESSGTSDEQEPIYVSRNQPLSSNSVLRLTPFADRIRTRRPTQPHELFTDQKMDDNSPSVLFYSLIWYASFPITLNTQHPTLNNQQPEQQEPTTWVSQA